MYVGSKVTITILHCLTLLQFHIQVWLQISDHHHHHHLSVMALGHLLTRSRLMYPEDAGHAIPKHAGPEAEDSNPTTGLTLLRASNPFRGKT
jgi:hypothetical protein